MWVRLHLLPSLGLDQEGIFRISGNKRVIEQLKTAIDNGVQEVFFDDDEVDVMTVAGLLKLFFRELPDSLIPEVMVKEFIDVHSSTYTSLLNVDSTLFCFHVWVCKTI